MSFQTVIMAFLGGATSVMGPALGAVFLGLRSETLLVQFRYFYMLVLGLVPIVVVLRLPARLAALLHRSRR